jgi:hypothetical protein
MAHYAVLNENNIVVSVFVGKDETDNTEPDWEAYYAQPGEVVKRTSYNTHGGVHIQGGVPYRKNYAGIGMIYDAEHDAFMWPQPYPSWVLNEATCVWHAPVPMPDDGQVYNWDETTTQWVLQEETT